jgi:hypothetical protein
VASSISIISATASTAATPYPKQLTELESAQTMSPYLTRTYGPVDLLTNKDLPTSLKIEAPPRGRIDLQAAAISSFSSIQRAYRLDSIMAPDDG